MQFKGGKSFVQCLAHILNLIARVIVMKGIEIDNNMIIYSQFMVMGRVVVLY